MMKVIYLAGPINGCSDSECKDWRNKVKYSVQDWGYDILDPMRRDYRDAELENIASIVEGDKKDVASCDILLANCVKPSFGTSMEIMLAKQLGKKVLIITKYSSPWLYYHADLVVGNVEEAINYLMRDI